MSDPNRDFASQLEELKAQAASGDVVAMLVLVVERLTARLLALELAMGVRRE